MRVTVHEGTSDVTVVHHHGVLFCSVLYHTVLLCTALDSADAIQLAARWPLPWLLWCTAGALPGRRAGGGGQEGRAGEEQGGASGQAPFETEQHLAGPRHQHQHQQLHFDTPGVHQGLPGGAPTAWLSSGGPGPRGA